VTGDRGRGARHPAALVSQPEDAMRMILGLALVAVMGLVAGGAGADDKDTKIDGKKLVGKWTPKDPEKDKFVVEFTKDGKLTFVGEKEGKLEGTYKLDGNKLVLTAKVGDKEQKMTRIISKLTDTELVSRRDEEGAKEETLVRVKEK
jgi:uncharacterized protein (TIGR03066 family)